MDRTLTYQKQLTENDFWLQAMFIIAWSEISILDVFQKDVLYRLSSIFITAAFLRFLQSMNGYLHMNPLYV